MITKTEKESTTLQGKPAGKVSEASAENAGEQLALPGHEAEESEVRELHGVWLDVRRKSLGIAIQLGRILTKLKAELKTAIPKRNWEPYVRDHLGIEPRTARNYMRLFKKSSSIETLGKILKSETVSEIGIRDALELLAEHDKAGKEKSTSPKSYTGSEKSQSGVKGSPRPNIQLADKSLIDLKKSRWVDGLIPLRSIESWVTHASSECDDKESVKVESQRQRAVVQIAAGINRACGKASPEKATEIAKASLEAVRQILTDSNDENPAQL